MAARAPTVVPSEDVAVCSVSADASTVTSCCWPISRDRLSTGVSVTLITTPPISAVLKPAAVKRIL